MNDTLSLCLIITPNICQRFILENTDWHDQQCQRSIKKINYADNLIPQSANVNWHYLNNIDKIQHNKHTENSKYGSTSFTEITEQLWNQKHTFWYLNTHHNTILWLQEYEVHKQDQKLNLHIFLKGSLWGWGVLPSEKNHETPFCLLP